MLKYPPRRLGEKQSAVSPNGKEESCRPAGLGEVLWSLSLSPLGERSFRAVFHVSLNRSSDAD